MVMLSVWEASAIKLMSYVGGDGGGDAMKVAGVEIRRFSSLM